MWLAETVIRLKHKGFTQFVLLNLLRYWSNFFFFYIIPLVCADGNLSSNTMELSSEEPLKDLKPWLCSVALYGITTSFLSIFFELFHHWIMDTPDLINNAHFLKLKIQKESRVGLNIYLTATWETKFYLWIDTLFYKREFLLQTSLNVFFPFWSLPL